MFHEIMNCKNRTNDAKGQVGQEQQTGQPARKKISIHLTVQVQSKHIFQYTKCVQSFVLQTLSCTN